MPAADPFATLSETERSRASARAGEPASERRLDLEDVGPATSAQRRRLRADGRVSNPDTLDRVGARLVRVRWRATDGTWGAWWEWLGLPALGDSWKLWAIDRNGNPRLDDRGSYTRRNFGPVSLLLSPDLHGATAAPSRIYDVEGESDYLAAVDAGLVGIVASTGGAASLAGHERHRAQLLALAPAEVVVVRDLDDAGRAGAAKAAAWWQAAGVPVRVLELPAELGEGGDVRDFLARCGGPADLDALTDAAELRPPTAGNGEAPEPDRRVRKVRLSDVTPERVSWLWKDRIPLGKITVLDGDPGLGKSTLALDLAARVTTGRPMPDGSQGRLGDVWLLSAEDGAADTILPRLEAAGGAPARVQLLEGIPVEGEADRLPELPEDVARLEAELGGALLVVVDPLMAYLGGDTNAHRDQDVRRALAPLAAMASRTGAAVVVIRHLNKGAGGANPLYRGGGSIGIVGAARSGLLVARDPEDPEGRVLAVTKANLAREAPALRFAPVDAGGVPVIDWRGECAHTAKGLLEAEADAREGGAVREACEVLRGILEGGPRQAKDVKHEAKAAGISERTLDRARTRLHVQASKAGFSGGWLWALPAKDAKDANDSPSAGAWRSSQSWRSSPDSGHLHDAAEADSTKSAKSGALASFDATDPLAPFQAAGVRVWLDAQGDPRTVPPLGDLPEPLFRIVFDRRAELVAALRREPGQEP
jgi:hypothetical protein